MTTRDERWRGYVAAYPIDVPEDAIREEMRLIEMDLRHRMQYDRLTGGGLHLFPSLELEKQADDLRAAAVFEAKSPLVLRELTAKLDFEVTQEELEEEARRMAERQGTTVDSIKSFFGADLAMLRRDVLERKIIDWAVAQEP